MTVSHQATAANADLLKQLRTSGPTGRALSSRVCLVFVNISDSYRIPQDIDDHGDDQID